MTKRLFRHCAAAVPPTGHPSPSTPTGTPLVATLEYTEPLVREAVFAFWRRTVGVGFLVAPGLLACALGYLLWHGDRSWLVGAMGACLLFGPGFALLLYAVHLRSAMARFRGMGAPVATIELAEASFTMSSGLGSTSLQWSAISEVWRFPSFWLLLFSKSQFVTLPLAAVPAEARSFILDRVTAAGGKVAG